MLKFLILWALAVLSVVPSFALPGTENTASHSFLIDTSGDKLDSLQLKSGPATPADPKDAFKNLYIPTVNANGVTMEELNPMVVSFVEDYMEKMGKTMENIKATSRPYFDMIDQVLTQHGLPKELKYLAVIESALKSNARSWAGAVGPWQFMPQTARNMGLKVNYKQDERRDLYKSTHAASRYLTNLFTLYGDWLLVIAAYNGGPGAVNSAIRRSGSREFWKLQHYLPAQSRNHVKKFIATHYIMEGEGGITTLTKSEANNRIMQALNDTAKSEEFLNAKLQSITGRYNSTVIAKHISLDMPAFNRLNPGFDSMIASQGSYPMRLPGDKMDLFLARKYDILAESIQLLLDPDGKNPGSTD
jgi:membrane-bound lytic murein transglycosylase D